VDARERKLRSVARKQHGVFMLSQALAAGFPRSTLRLRVESGLWETLEPRAFRIADGVCPSPRALLMAKVLATRGVASGMSAAALYGLVDFPISPVVTVRRRSRTAAHEGVCTTDVLGECDITTVDRVPATTPVRTMLDLAGALPLERFEDVFDRAIVTRVVRVHRLERRARELWAPRRSGCARVLALIAARHPDLARARSEMEARVLRIVDELGLPRPEVNFRVVTGGEVRYIDLAWPEQKVAVEFDGFVPHSTRRVFDDDRVRQNHLVADEWRVFRLTKTALVRNARAAFAPIAALVGR
jgi:very-short-patch-repair endonuclease